MSFLCPNWCLTLFSSKKNNKTPSGFDQPERAEMLDQQQQIADSLKRQVKQLPSEYFEQTKQTRDHEKDMNVDLGLGYNQEDKRSQNSSKEQRQADNQASQKDLNENNIQQTSDAPTQQQLKPNYNKFSINLDPYDKYYKLLHEKTENLEKYFNNEQESVVIDMGQTQCKLKVFKIQTNKFQIRLQLPCSYAFYSMLMKDSNMANKKYMSHFLKSQVFQAFRPNFTKNVVTLKRYNVLQPRQFVYLKYSNGSFKQNWQICISEHYFPSVIQEDLLSKTQSLTPRSPNDIQTKNCDFFSVSNFKEINEKLYVRQYLQVDLKASNINNYIWSKIMNEVREYYERLYVHVQNNYQKELV